MSQSIPDFLRIRIRHANGEEVFDPNSLIMAFVQTPERIHNLAPTDQVSVLSGEPALLYETNEVLLPLTSAEIYRLTLRALRPKEALVLLGRFRSFFEIHDDFYDPKTGEAFQPKIDADDPLA